MARELFRAFSLTAIAVLLLPDPLWSQVRSGSFLLDTLSVGPADTVLHTSARFLQQGSVTLSVLGGPNLVPEADFQVNASQGRIVLSPQFLARFASSVPPARIIVRYRALPLRFRDSYRSQSAEAVTSQGRPVVAPSATKATEPIDWFGKGLQRSGSIVRGVTVGTNRDASLSSGLRLQLAGELARDVNVVAALSDENSPLQPEGSTQTLREVDRVFIDITGRQYGMTLGDFVYNRDRSVGGAFGVVSRKFQGAQAAVRSLDISSAAIRATAGVVGASARGKFHTNRFQGSDGNQGPYRLAGKNGELRVIVIAGSERVTINGEAMTRGEVQDYVIDYAAGELLFTGRRRITSASRIVVDFEYADRQYARNALGATLDATVGDSIVVFHSGILQESDDADSPLDFTLDESLRSLLRSSGADRLKASLSSVRNVGIDTTSGRGAGQYVGVDTLLQGRIVTIYRYAPGDPRAVYTIAFAPVSQMPSDSAGYQRVSAGEYRFAGIGAGTYLPVQFIPIPQLQRNAHATIRLRPLTGITLTADLAGSLLDRNRLSDLDDNGSSGSAQVFGLQIDSGPIQWGSTDLGTMSLAMSQRTITSAFVTPDRLDPAEYERTWDLPAARATGETRREADVKYAPRHWLSTAAFVGTVDRPGEVSSRRIGASAGLQDSAGRQVSFETESLRRDLRAAGTQSTWDRQGLRASWPLGAFTPSIGVRSEDREDGLFGSDSLSEGSFRTLEWTPRVSWVPSGSVSAAAEIQVRSEDSTLSGSSAHAFDALTQAYTAEVRPWEMVNSSLALNIRRTSFTDDFRLRGNGDATTMLVRSHTRVSTPARSVDGDVLYGSNQRSAKLERVFIRVARGTGNYRYLGDTNGNGIADEAEFELVRFDGDYVALLLPGEALVPVNDVKASIRVRWNGSRMTQGEGPALLKALSTETLLRVEERSSDPVTSNVYGLRLGSFLRNATTISGAQTVTQDIHLYEGDPQFSLRLRIGEARGLTQMVSAPERTYGSERSVRVRHRWTVEIGQQTDLWVKRDRMLSTFSNPRERDLTSVGGIADFTYRIERRWEAGWSLGLTSISDARNGRTVEAALNDQSLRVVYVMPAMGQVRAELRREEARLSSSTGAVPTILPFELTEGRSVGRSWLWRLSAELQVSSLVQVSLGYFGRQEGAGSVVHTARAEARATF